MAGPFPWAVSGALLVVVLTPGVAFAQQPPPEPIGPPDGATVRPPVHFQIRSFPNDVQLTVLVSRSDAVEADGELADPFFAASLESSGPDRTLYEDTTLGEDTPPGTYFWQPSRCQPRPSATVVECATAGPVRAFTLLAPVLRFSYRLRRTQRLDSGPNLTGDASCNLDCTVVVSGVARPAGGRPLRVSGPNGGFRLGPGTMLDVRLVSFRLPQRTRALLRRVGRLRFALRGTVTDRLGRRLSFTRRVTLLPPAPAARRRESARLPRVIGIEGRPPPKDTTAPGGPPTSPGAPPPSGTTIASDRAG